MPTAAIDVNGTQIYYQDSGPPQNTLGYTTIFVTHGVVVNGVAFERVLPFAGTHGLRIITMNNRDYSGSTPYTDAEIADFLDTVTEVQASAVRRWGEETASFLRFVCQMLGVPRAGGGAGGIILMAEGLGNIATLAILGDARTLGPELSTALAPYLRSVVLYAKANAFVDWCSAHYAPISSVADITPEALRARDTPLPATPSLRKLTDEDLARMTNPGVTGRSALIITTAVEIRQTHLRCAFMDAEPVFPGVNILALWCDSSVWDTLWGARVVDELMKEEPEPGKRKRRTELVGIEDSNHFVHLEQPERLVRLLAELTSKNS
ncbi:hypothetical protein PsYK624_071750 [Phanerochaete sordida]|uniref:AB hydrolase-1 domain-containing protein n=1 Tax=Phanerochaete sordida TaxID=48140 RepID=A0A9P3G847_9APHY|nr:hypothetical protein PsYK624_071750 [Phanerochaete sordida]